MRKFGTPMKLKSLAESDLLIWKAHQMTPGVKTSALPPLSHKNSAGKLRNLSPLERDELPKSGTMKGKSLKKIVFSDKKVTRFAGLKIIIGDNEKASVIQEDDSEGSLKRAESLNSNLNPF
jgi:hypothetical protein